MAGDLLEARRVGIVTKAGSLKIGVQMMESNKKEKWGVKYGLCAYISGKEDDNNLSFSL